jgi:hypothetical protein
MAQIEISASGAHYDKNWSSIFPLEVLNPRLFDMGGSDFPDFDMASHDDALVKPSETLAIPVSTILFERPTAQPVAVEV